MTPNAILLFPTPTHRLCRLWRAKASVLLILRVLSACAPLAVLGSVFSLAIVETRAANDTVRLLLRPTPCAHYEHCHWRRDARARNRSSVHPREFPRLPGVVQ